MTTREKARVEYLHAAFSEIEAQSVAGARVVPALHALSRRRSRYLPRGKYSRGSILSLYYRWRKNRSPSALLRNYRSTKNRRIPPALILEFLNRLVQSEIVSAHAAINSLRSDWRRGIALPGIGTWRERCGGTRCTAPRFPFSKTAFYDLLSRNSKSRFQRLATMALRGQRDVRRFEAFIEARREALCRQVTNDAPVVQSTG